MLSIDSVTIGLNGTVIHCMEAEGSMPASKSTIIQVIDATNSELASNHCCITGISIIY